jgi:hypothetical protein
MVHAEYTSPDFSQSFVSNDTPVPLQTDKNAPTEPSSSPLGQLRRDVVNVQYQINQFLTQRMKEDKSTEQAERLEKEILDGDDGMEQEE